MTTLTLTWHKRREEIDDNVEFIAKCMRLWDSGMDTWGIAHIMFQPEFIIERAVRLGRERRRQMEEKNAEDEKWDRP